MGVMSVTGLLNRKRLTWLDCLKFSQSVHCTNANTVWCRYPEIMYTQEGARVRERLWEETMEELNFAGVSDIMRDMKMQ